MTSSRTAVSIRTRLETIASPTARQVVGVLTFALLTALSARIELPIPGTGVPFTFQPMAVILAGALLGSRLGALSQIAYLAAGFAGLPVFSSVALTGVTAGFLFAFPVSAYVVGAIAGSTMVRNGLALLAGLATLYAGGLAWLTILFGFENALRLGFYPFILPDLVKAGIALIVVQQLRARSLRLFGG